MINKNYKKYKDEYIPVIPYSEKLSRKEEELDSYLSELKKKADNLYIGNNPYGVVEWDDLEDIYPDFYNFCFDLPKGGDLHAHDNIMISYDGFVEIIKDNAMISLEGERSNLYSRYSSDLPDNAVDVSVVLEKG